MPTKTIACPHCRGLSKVNDATGQANFRCPHCQGVISIAEPEPREVRSKSTTVRAAELSCPSCQGRFRIPSEFDGELVKCPHCEDAVRVDSKSNSGTPTQIAEQPAFKIETNPDKRTGRGTAVGSLDDGQEDGSFVISVGNQEITLRDEPKTVDYRGAKLRVRQLSRDERSNRRSTRNLVVGIVALLTLILTAAMLIRE